MSIRGARAVISKSQSEHRDSQMMLMLLKDFTPSKWQQMCKGLLPCGETELSTAEQPQALNMLYLVSTSAQNWTPLD